MTTQMIINLLSISILILCIICMRLNKKLIELHKQLHLIGAEIFLISESIGYKLKLFDLPNYQKNRARECGRLNETNNN